MTFVGIDGCKAGWLMIIYKSGQYDWKVSPQIEQIATHIKENTRIFIDMPIGLASEEFPRTIEKVLRKELGNRSSTVFNVPVREAVYENDRRQAKLINIATTGKTFLNNRSISNRKF